ncbi:complex I NDUFA9 subunit family protein [Aquabacterium sp.]|uniref:complex I NDUFA9 subunit family protein n=1 Tax=Aquabacterium sp. TaxID=1872578 RepID=UPI002488029A|nr:complex I NDUFA9 subunit family protein [Aquabacterium sp.]MDI1261006.1 complex I NDUFA9 subunit family protein [Aquabacterium sp.]
MKRWLVLGGSGFVGRALCEQLVDEHGSGGVRITVPTRRRAHAQHLLTLPTVEVVEASVHDENALMRLLVGCDGVVNLIAILHGSKDEFEHAHVGLPQRLAAACVRAGVRRVVHVSALGVPDDPAAAPSNYLRSKAAGELALRAAGLDLTVLRPSVIFGAHDQFLNLFASLQAVFPVLPLAGSDAQFQPVWVGDVARALARCLADPGTVGQTYECTGPQVYTLKELVAMAGWLSGHARPIVPIPLWAGRLQALAMSILPGEPLMSQDNLDSMQVPNVATGRWPGLQALGVAPTPVTRIAPGYLGGKHAGGEQLNDWRTRAGR